MNWNQGTVACIIRGRVKKFPEFRHMKITVLPVKVGGGGTECTAMDCVIHVQKAATC